MGGTTLFNMKRKWHSVIGYEGRYEVSTFGEVRSFVAPGARRSNQPHVLAQDVNQKGYPIVRLSLFRGHQHQRTVHKLVLEAFRGPCPQGHCCRHLDGVITNNILSNIIWGTPKENAEDRTLHGHTALGKRNTNSKLTAQKVRTIRKLKGRVSQYRLAEKLGVSQAAVWYASQRKTWKHVE